VFEQSITGADRGAPEMVQSHLQFWQRSKRYVAVAFLPFALACGSHKTQSVKVTPTAPAAPVERVVAPVPDPVLVLIAASNSHFEAGRHELEQGHFDAAKVEFDRAVDMLLESPFGARTEPRLREHFDRLVDRVSAYEVKALAEGDGFTEKKYEAASIDELLSETTFGSPTAAAAELAETVLSDLETSEHDIPIPLNERVLAYIELFQGRLHDFIEEGMKRGGKYLPMIQNVFRAEGLPLDLAYVPLVESAFKPNALSRANAKGVWQFMAGTAAENGLRRDWYIDERSDPEKATLAAAKYLQTLAKMFDGDWHLALASYNGGPGRLQNAIKRAGGIDDFWQLSAKAKLLPRETREYVPMILAAIVIARNPLQYGFDFEPEIASAYEKVTLSKPVDLRRVAEWAETTIDEIQALNPELRRWTTPVRDAQYELKVPAGTAEQVSTRLADAAAVELASLNWYTAKRGDTLALIAKKLKVSKNDLAEANYLSATSRVSIGQKLMVPREATVLMAARSTPTDDTSASEKPEKTPAVVAAARQIVPETGALASTAGPNRVKVIYAVKRGDTLASIARLFKTTVAALQDWNPRIPGDRIAAGQRLTVYRLARS
jgi:membrane-bound lytic murein transglycosylase D